ncbi:uncharacterized protein OCT59_012822 [Rhizophagus irregularis]|uniref:uncharacterized protein n=1 Tax=Rhizophagus irregularis TaxID=588596 RepID=UPI003328ECF0|nr:hypothetical protein OCT59_012822 [Rhizophagus irregularis]
MRKIGTYAATSLHLFHDVTKGLVISKRLSQEEEHWISKASIGSIIWAEPYEGNAKQYDVNEFYPSVLLQKEAKWPTCLYMQGECDQLYTSSFIHMCCVLYEYFFTMSDLISSNNVNH